MQLVWAGLLRIRAQRTRKRAAGRRAPRGHPGGRQLTLLLASHAQVPMVVTQRVKEFLKHHDISKLK